MQLDEFQPKSAEPFQEAKKMLPSHSADVEMGHYHCRWQSLLTEIWWISWVLGVILWKELAEEQLCRIDQFLGTFLESA